MAALRAHLAHVAHARRDGPPEPGGLLEAVGEGTILADHFLPIFRPAFPSSAIVSERSSPSRVRFAAPNNGAPLTAPGRSEQHLLDKRERHMPNGLQGRGPLRRQNGTLFRRHRQRRGSRLLPKLHLSTPQMVEVPMNLESANRLPSRTMGNLGKCVQLGIPFTQPTPTCCAACCADLLRPTKLS